jgi:hypothetical protein
MVDGDPQQRDELSKAIEEYIPNARIGGCGWHIVNQGWKRHGPNKTAVIEGTKRDKYQLFTKHVKDWIYSWMTPGGAESLEEYSLSKELLFAYVSSHEGLGACDGHHHIITQITDFVCQYVIIYDNLFLFYKKKNIRYFNTKTSSAHEGTNYGIKEHAASVRPSQRLSVATRNLSLQSSMKASQMEAESTYAVSSSSLWTSSPTSNYLTTLAESMVSQNFSRIKHYGIRRTAANIFEVPFTNDNHIHDSTDRVPGIENSPIPKYARLRVVRLIDGSLICECCHQERVGISCVHTMAVIKHYYPEWKGPTHHKQSPRWWLVWLQFAHKSKFPELTAALEMVMNNEVPGPRFPSPIPPEATYLPSTPTKPARDRILNYSSELLERLVPSQRVSVVWEEAGERTVIIVEGLTQESFIPHTCPSGTVHEHEQHGNGFEDTYFSGDENEPEEPSNAPVSVFVESLRSDILQLHNDLARDIFKAQMNELFQCLDSLKSSAMNEKVANVLDDLVNRTRLELASLTSRKRNIDNVLTVNVNVEASNKGKKRVLASKNC